MSDCQHESRTIDCVCNDCGYDFIVGPMTEKIRKQERERIIKLLDVVEYPNGNETKFQTLVDTVFEGEMLFGDFRRELIALIKGENN